MATFLNVRFPTDISQGTQSGPGFNTVVSVAGSGVEQRSSLWLTPRYKYDAQYATKTPTQMQALVALFNACQGMGYSFRFKDWTDYWDAGNGVAIIASTMLTAQPTLPQAYDGASPLQLYKTYIAGTNTMFSKISKPVQGASSPSGIAGMPPYFKLYANGVQLVENTQFTMDYTMGIITLTTPTSYTGESFTWTGQFDRHVRFDIDELKFTADAATVQSLSSIPLVEIRD